MRLLFVLSIALFQGSFLDLSTSERTALWKGDRDVEDVNSICLKIADKDEIRLT